MINFIICKKDFSEKMSTKALYEKYVLEYNLAADSSVPSPGPTSSPTPTPSLYSRLPPNYTFDPSLLSSLFTLDVLFLLTMLNFLLDVCRLVFRLRMLRRYYPQMSPGVQCTDVTKVLSTDVPGVQSTDVTKVLSTDVPG